MLRSEFLAFRSNLRKISQSAQLLHNGRRYSIGRHDCDRLDSRGCYDRVKPANVAMAINQAGDCRRRLELKSASRVLCRMAREWRKESQE